MKLLLGIICLMTCTFIGYYLSRKYTVRKEFFNNFFDFNKLLKNEISFTQDSLIEFVKKNCNKKTIFYSNVSSSIIDNKKQSLDKTVFTMEEIEYFNQYLDNIGATDKITQLAFLESAALKLKENLDKANDEEKKYKSLFIKLGFLIGLISLIILL